MRKTSTYKGDALGRIDEDGIAQWFPKCKVRKEGNVYIATPHTTNTAKRTVRKEKPIAVTVNDGKYALEQPKNKPNDRIVEPTDKSQIQPNNDIQITTHKQIFDELYDKHYKLNHIYASKLFWKKCYLYLLTKKQLNHLLTSNGKENGGTPIHERNDLNIRHITKITNTFSL